MNTILGFLAAVWAQAFIVACFICLLTLTACDDSVDCVPVHTVHKIAEAPDGTILWRDQCHYVYFSSRGTQYEISAGKHHETVQVPNEDR